LSTFELPGDLNSDGCKGLAEALGDRNKLLGRLPDRDFDEEGDWIKFILAVEDKSLLISSLGPGDFAAKRLRRTFFGFEPAE